MEAAHISRNPEEPLVHPLTQGLRQNSYWLEVKAAYLDSRGELQWRTYRKPDLTLGWVKGTRRMRRWAKELKNETLEDARLVRHRSLVAGTPPRMSPIRIAAAEAALTDIYLHTRRVRVLKRELIDWSDFVRTVDLLNCQKAKVAIVLAGLLKARGDWTMGDGFE